jgi:hypothetical protein
MIMGEEAEQTAKTDPTKPRESSPPNAAKRSFKDFVANDGLRMGKILEDIDEVWQLTYDVLTASENLIKRARIIEDKLIESQKYIREFGGVEIKVTDR